MFTKKILIVSPSAVFRLTLKRFLQDKFTVKTIKNLENLKDMQFDLTVYDISGGRHSNPPKNAILIGDCSSCLKKPEFVDKGFARKVIQLINKKLDIKQASQPAEQVCTEPERYILIGSSTGGPGLIETIARSLPENYKHPICVVQHMPNGFTAKFANRLNTISKLTVVESNNTQAVTPGFFIIAKADWHLHFRKKEEKIYCKHVPNTKNRFFIPSVDEMFFSALHTIEPSKIVAIILSGIGDDGAEGMAALRNANAYTIAESEKTATVYGMPKEAKERGGAVKVLDFPDIVKEILSL